LQYLLRPHYYQYPCLGKTYSLVSSDHLPYLFRFN
jgi:hypothetical protein